MRDRTTAPSSSSGDASKKKLVVGRPALTVGIEPRALTGHVIEHQIRHQRELIRDAVDVRPITQLWIDGAKIGHGKTVVGGEGKEWQDVHAVIHTGQVAAQKVVEQIQRLMRLILERIAIGDDQRVALGPLGIARLALDLAARRPAKRPQ